MSRAKEFRVQCVLFITLNLLITLIDSKTFLILGETGQGKSTFIKHIGGVVEDVPIGHTPNSATVTVDIYKGTAKFDPLFDGATLIDTPGLFDTKGMTAAEIKNLTEIALIRNFKTDANAQIDGIILLASTRDTRSRLMINFQEYIELFSEEVLECSLLLVNKNPMKPKANDLMEEAEKTVKTFTRYNGKKMVDPVEMDVQQPSDVDRLTFIKALNNLKPYKLKNLEIRKHRIKEIYDELITNIENLVEYNVTMIKPESRESTEETVVYEDQIKHITKYVPQDYSIAGVISFTRTKSVKEDVVIKVPVIKQLKKSVEVDVAHNELRTRLKNEENFYWQLAANLYEKELKEKLMG